MQCQRTVTIATKKLSYSVKMGKFSLKVTEPTVILYEYVDDKRRFEKND